VGLSNETPWGLMKCLQLGERAGSEGRLGAGRAATASRRAGAARRRRPKLHGPPQTRRAALRRAAPPRSRGQPQSAAGGVPSERLQVSARAPVSVQNAALCAPGQPKYSALNRPPGSTLLWSAPAHSPPRAPPRSLLCRTFDSGLAEACHLEGVSLLAYSPLAMGLLTVRPRRRQRNRGLGAGLGLGGGRRGRRGLRCGAPRAVMRGGAAGPAPPGHAGGFPGPRAPRAAAGLSPRPPPRAAGTSRIHIHGAAAP
jgi:hypothetical protein